MSTVKSDNSDLTINASGSTSDIKFQANGVEKASISSAGAFTSTTIDATALTGLVTDDTVDESSLKSDNAPTNDYVLTAKSSATGGLTWAAAAASGLSSKVVSFTHDTSSTTSQAVTGVGFQPTCILFFSSKGYVAGWGSIGWVDSSKAGNSYADTHNRTADTFTKGAKNTAQILGMEADTSFTEGNISTYDSDGFTLDWTKSGTPTGTIYIDALCFK